MTERTLTLPVTGLFGEYFAPPGASHRPGVVLWGGGEGGLRPFIGELIASHGIPVLDLAYIGEPGLPQSSGDLPLEYFVRAVRWLGRQPEVDPRRVWLLSWSFGTEAEQLVAAHWPGLVHGVVAQSATAVPFTSWTLHGVPLPQGVYDSSAVQYDRDGRVRQAPGVIAGLSDTTATRNALIPLDRFRGAFLLCVGQDDQLSAASANAPLIMGQLRGDPSPHEELAYPGAGHTIFLPPYAPPLIDDGNLDEGGTPTANSAAQERNWPAVLAFIAGN